MFKVRTLVSLAAASGLAVALAGCSGGSPAPAAPVTARGTEQASQAVAQPPVDPRYVFPQFPAVVIPDFTALTNAAPRVVRVLADLTTATSGLAVAGARCDTAGKIINRGSLTALNGGDGSAAFREGSLRVTSRGGRPGVHQDGALKIVAAQDGSGTLSYASARVTIAADGSGTYRDGSLWITLDGAGAGVLKDGSLNLVNNGDGSGTLKDGSLTVVNHGDGSGQFDDASLHVINSGRGTAIIEDGSDSGTISMPPLKPLPPLGAFPAAGALGPVGTACGTLIRLDDTVLFDVGTSTLRRESRRLLDRVAKALTGTRGRLEVHGHTDSEGDDASNRDLSQRRADAVRKALAKRGVSARITAKGYGETQPIAPNTTGGTDDLAGRQLNRRVEILIPAR
jgi:OOP family OmpA-OmpF porin